MIRRLVTTFICAAFFLGNLQLLQAQDFTVNQLPLPGTMVGESAPFVPLALKGLVVNPQKPLELQFLVDTGNSPFAKEETGRLIKYFLAGLTIPEEDLWVNLSPYEKNRITTASLGQTELGRDLLAQDYILKQLTASLIYPEKDLGKEFWSRVYTKAREQFGTTDITVNTFNKVWIVPDQAQVYENTNAVYVTKSTLKVMLEEDYLSRQKHASASANDDPPAGSTQGELLGADIVRQVVIPEIEKEVNTGRNFAPLRQIYCAMILAKWYKETIQNTFLDAVYTNRKKIGGVSLDDLTVKEKIYQRYLQAYRRGVFDYIREDRTPDGQSVLRKYFSGGLTPMPEKLDRRGSFPAVKSAGTMVKVDVNLQKFTDHAMKSAEGRPPIYKDIRTVIAELNNIGVKPRVHNTDLMVFSHNSTFLVEFIKRYSVLKDPEDIYRILLWRLHTAGRKSQVPLSGLETSKAQILYNAIFDQDQFWANRRQQKPLNIVLFRRGRSQQLTNVLKTLPGVNIKLILSGTEDGLSWYYGAREFKATGISGAGRALANLYGDSAVKDFVTYRFQGNGISDAQLESDFRSMIKYLVNHEAKVELSGEMKTVYFLAMSMPVDKRKEIIGDLSLFLNYWDETRKPDSGFNLRHVPVRSILLVGMARRFNQNWQEAIDELGRLLGVRPGNSVILPTRERQHLVGIRDDGTVYFSESSINLYKPFSPFLGLWLLDDETYNNLVSQSAIDLGGGRWTKFGNIRLAEDSRLSQSEREEVMETTRTVPKKDLKLLVNHISRISTTGRLSEKKAVLTPEGQAALKGADVILYGEEFVEINVGGALIVPGVARSIASNKNALKINLVEVSERNRSETVLMDYLDRLHWYLTHKRKNASGQEFLTDAQKYVNYVVGGMVQSIEPTEGMTEKVEQASGNKVHAVTVDAHMQTKQGFYSATVLIESMISLLGIKYAGFEISDKHGLTVGNYVRDKLFKNKLKMGLFSGRPEVQDLIKNIRGNWTQIVKRGAFVFDVDKTVLPKNAHGLIDYIELAHLFMRLLREGVRVAIISGNSREEQMVRIYEAIKDEMRDDLSDFKYLTFYVNGGATKIGFDNNGYEKEDMGYNNSHGMAFSVLNAAINGAMNKVAGAKFNLAPDVLQEFLDETRRYVHDKYPGLNVEFPWLTDANWMPSWVTPEQISSLSAARGTMAVPWVEVRGKTNGTVASIAIKPTPEFSASNGTKVDTREGLQAEILRFTESLHVRGNDFKLRSGGSTTTDITKANAEKPAALLDFVDSNHLDQHRVYYLADEFFVRNGQEGNDEVIARHPSLQNVQTLAVNGDDMKGAAPKTLWIGRSPQATLEFLRTVLADQAMLHGGIDLNRINVRRTGRVIKMPFDPTGLEALQQGGFEGFTPVIVHMTYISSPWPSLGINPSQAPAPAAKAGTL
jgi:hypothetical protein